MTVVAAAARRNASKLPPSRMSEQSRGELLLAIFALHSSPVCGGQLAAAVRALLAVPLPLGRLDSSLSDGSTSL